jgi:hypothetical protein
MITIVPQLVRMSTVVFWGEAVGVALTVNIINQILFTPVTHESPVGRYGKIHIEASCHKFVASSRH